MASIGNPAETRAYILERLVGETGEPDRVTQAAMSAAERAASPFAQGLLDALSITLDVSAKRVDLTRFSEARPDADSHATAVLATTFPLGDTLMMVLDADALALIVSTCFGGDPTMPVAAIERDPSPLELEVAGTVLAQLSAALNAHGPRAVVTSMPLPEPVCGVELKKLALRDGPAARIVFGISTPAGRGEISVIVPQRILLKDSVDPAAAKDAGPSAWGARFGEEVMRSTVSIEATMPMSQLTLGELSVLTVGQVVPFDIEARNKVVLTARGRTLFMGEFGKLGQNYTVRVTNPHDGEQDMIEEWLPAARR